MAFGGDLTDELSQLCAVEIAVSAKPTHRLVHAGTSVRVFVVESSEAGFRSCSATRTESPSDSGSATERTGRSEPYTRRSTPTSRRTASTARAPYDEVSRNTFR